MNRKIIYIGLATCLVCTFFVHAALVSMGRSSSAAVAPPLDLADNQIVPKGQILPVADTITPAPAAPAPKAAPAQPAPETAAAPAPESDGKTVLPAVGDGKTVLAADDGKTVLPADGKSDLPPAVGEQIGQQRVDPGVAGPPVEFLNRPESPSTSSNPLLNPPNPVNVGGPTVSAETPE